MVSKTEVKVEKGVPGLKQSGEQWVTNYCSFISSISSLPEITSLRTLSAAATEKKYFPIFCSGDTMGHLIEKCGQYSR
jgi:hypothetical protein